MLSGADPTISPWLRSAADPAAGRRSFCLAWPRPLIIGATLIALAGLLEALQALTPDRSSNFFAALYSASGVLAAAVFAELFIRARRWFQSKQAETTRS
jgi:hypothetical protein